MYTFPVHNKTVSVFSSAKPGTPVIYLNTFSNEGQQVFQTAQDAGCPPFTLVAISDLNWNHDMTPWDSPSVFKNAPPCTGGGNDYKRLLIEEIMPEAEKKIATEPQWRGIAGYSLAGLFAVYSIYQTDIFSRVASVSGSLWFPGMKEYVFSHEPKRRPDCMYFSLGDKESKTRNPVLKTVRQNTEEIEGFYQSQRIDTIFQLNPGNHYNHAVERTVAGISWLLSRDAAKKALEQC